MCKKKILFVCGSLNQTTINYQISLHLQDYALYFTPFYSDGLLHLLTKAHILDFSILGGKPKRSTDEFLQDHDCSMDYRGISHDYDLVLTCGDLIVPKNIRNKPVILVQEGMTDPENWRYHLVRKLHLPRVLANTSMTGLSDVYQKMCVASEGFKEIFIRKGVKPEKIVVTGIPNFDYCEQYLDNNFPHKHYVLAATSHLRESFKYENRKKFILNTVRIADGRPIIFKLHPNERTGRAIREINRYAPGSIIYTEGNTNHMIANCDVMVTKYSSVILVALALGKEIYSDIDAALLPKLTPLQNKGKSAENIAHICRQYLEG